MTLPAAEGSPSRRAPEEVDLGESTLSGGEVRQRAASGALLVGIRSVVIRALNLVGALVLARLLVPEDFGILAFGQTLIVFAGFFADAGMGASLVRRAEPPSRAELRSLLGFQMLVAVLVVAAAAAVAVPTGRSGQVAALMSVSVVLLSARTPASLLLERRLDYRTLATAEVAEGLVFVVWSITSVVLGFGVWGVASAHLVRALTGSVLVIARSPVKVLRPGLDFRVLAGLLRYGLVVQASGLVNLVRAQGINITTAAVAGLPVLGYYSLADRIIQLPWLVFETALRVTFPAMARLVSEGHDPRQDIERALRLVTLVAGPLLCLVAATAPVLVPSVFGTRWEPATPVLPLVALGLLLTGPLIAVGNGYLTAVGDARKVVTGTLAHTVVWFAVALPLLPRLGATAVGAGLCAGFLAEALVVDRAMRVRTGLRCLRMQAPVNAVIVVVGAAGLAASSRLEPSLLVTAGVAVAVSVALGLGLLLTSRATLVEGFELLRRILARQRAA